MKKRTAAGGPSSEALIAGEILISREMITRPSVHLGFLIVVAYSHAITLNPNISCFLAIFLSDHDIIYHKF
jgi:hypothetical protein